MITNNNILDLCKIKENKRSLRLTCKVLIALSAVCIFSSIISAEPLPEDANLANTLAYDVNSKATSSLENDLLIAKSPITDISRKLWQDRIAYLKVPESNTGRNDLEMLIDQIRSVEFNSQNQTQEPFIALELAKDETSDKKDLPNDSSSSTITTQVIEPAKSESTISGNRFPFVHIKEQTLQIFKDLSQKPEQLQNPLELAEILFNSRCLAEAAKCYQEALDRITDDNTDQNRKRAWILFQAGNCLQDDDPKTATRMYKQLTLQYPDSPWADLANAKAQLINWYQKNKPDTLTSKPKLQASLP